MADRLTVQFLITPASGKRLIAKAIAALPEIKEALHEQTIAIIAGTTNAYVADEILKSIDRSDGFSMRRFFRGISLPPGYSRTQSGRLEKNEFPGDVVIEKGIWHKGKTIFETADGLEKGDIIIKGANALDMVNGQAGIYIGDKKAGTIGVAMQCVYGRRVSLYLPVGLEKRVPGSIQQIADTLNRTNASGPRLLPVNGKIITELTAIEILTGAGAILAAAGGICGAEGSCSIAVTGTRQQVENARALYDSVSKEPPFTLESD